MAYNYNTVVFVETTHFSQLLKEYLDDEEYREMQYYLMEHPEAGEIITGSGGIRKLRWAAKAWENQVVCGSSITGLKREIKFIC